MAENLVARKRNTQGGTKVKTGCATCRIRKIKCDQNKPCCKRCVDTGRTCDGYESPFRHFAGQPVFKAHASRVNSSSIIRSGVPSLMDVAPQDFELLSRCFSTKTLFNVKLGCDEEAKQVLQASKTSPAIRHAVISLRALREDLETHGDVLASVAQQTSSYDYGLQQYCMALGGLAADLSAPGSDRLRSALLCCQMFISIEQVQGNYTSMCRHLIQGLRIMDQYRARPKLVATNRFLPAHHDQLPLLDVFIVKLFAAPCNFAESPTTFDISGTAVVECPLPLPQRSTRSGDLRLIAPDLRAKLIRIASTTLDFLGKVSRVRSGEEAPQLLHEKAYLLGSLEMWLMDLELVHRPITSPVPETISITFLRLFHQVLKIVLLDALDSSPDLYTELQTENNRLLNIACKVDKRVQTLRARNGGQKNSQRAK